MRMCRICLLFQTKGNRQDVRNYQPGVPLQRQSVQLGRAMGTQLPSLLALFLLGHSFRKPGTLFVNVFQTLKPACVKCQYEFNWFFKDLVCDFSIIYTQMKIYGKLSFQCFIAFPSKLENNWTMKHYVLLTNPV